MKDYRGTSSNNYNTYNNYENNNSCGRNNNDRRFFDGPFNSEVVTYAAPVANGGGDCALVHEQFFLNFMDNLTPASSEIVYTATRFIRCQDSAAIFPFGTIIVRNFSNFPVEIIVSGDTNITQIVQANSEAVIVSNSIGQINVELATAQGGRARVLFAFDLFYPAFPAVLV